MKPRGEVVSGHAERRAKERKVSDIARRTIKEGKAFVIMGTDANYHIVKQPDKQYVVGVERDKVVITFLVTNVEYLQRYLQKRTNNVKSIPYVRRLPVVTERDLLLRKYYDAAKELNRNRKRPRSFVS